MSNFQKGNVVTFYRTNPKDSLGIGLIFELSTDKHGKEYEARVVFFKDKENREVLTKKINTKKLRLLESNKSEIPTLEDLNLVNSNSETDIGEQKSNFSLPKSV